MQKAFVIGGSGLVGGKLVEVLAESKKFAKVVLMGRRNFEHPKAAHIEDKIIDFENLKTEDFEGFDIGFCALGSKPSHGNDMKYKVEYDYTLAVARLAKANGTKTFVIVTGEFPDADSRFIAFRLKGEIEREITKIDFERLVILRPGYIDGEKGGAMSCVLKTASHVSSSVYTTTNNVAKTMVYGSLAEGLAGQTIWRNKDFSEKAEAYQKLIAT